jgi:FMN hydrolase / 5-amino-6-(5-phospho-D-ribitylamino)uracil phosphatase
MAKITSIKTISFDGDQTLWDFQKVMRNSLNHAMKALQKADPIAASRLDIDKMIRIRNRVAGELKGRVTNLEQVRLEAFRQTLIEADRPDDKLAAHLNAVYLKHRFEDTELYEDVLPALTELRRKYKLGLLSNGNSYPERCGLGGVFQYIVFSQDCGYEKPDPRFFQTAVTMSGFIKEELLHVGDSLENDVIGANNAGIKSIWLNRDNLKPDSAHILKYEIHSLRELLELV